MPASQPTRAATIAMMNRPMPTLSSASINQSISANRSAPATTSSLTNGLSPTALSSMTRRLSSTAAIPTINKQSTTIPIAAKSFEMSEADFNKIRALIYRHAGIVISPTKREMVYGRLVRRLRDLGITGFDKYVEIIERNRSDELEKFINAMTTNLTSFFREAHHFPILAKHLSLMRPNHLINIWCSASSTGEEPYSIAMTAADTLGLANPGVRILATDLDTAVLETAKAGIYPTTDVLKLPTNTVRQYFKPDTFKPMTHMRVRDEIKRLVTFNKLNLLSDFWNIPSSLDAIFCRNVLIYFDRSTQRKILERFAPLLRQDGLLFVGHSESLLHSSDLFKPLGNTVYCRVT